MIFICTFPSYSSSHRLLAGVPAATLGRLIYISIHLYIYIIWLTMLRKISSSRKLTFCRGEKTSG